MRVYLDSSALIKRVLAEPEADELEDTLERHVAEDAVLASSALAWIEVTRALHRRFGDDPAQADALQTAIEVALSSVAERLITGDVVALARRLAPPQLRTLDAVHLASAILLDADLVVAYDARLLGACRHHGLRTAAPGR